MNIKKYWMMLAIALVSLCMVSCSKDDGEENGNKSTITASDPEGTIIANLQNTFHATINGYYDDGIENMNGKKYVYLGMNSSNNLEARSNKMHIEVSIVSVGKVNGLSSIKEIPNDGWTNQVAAIPGYGYVYRLEYNSGTYTYARIYAVDYMTSTSGGIMGITIKYQENWEPDTK